MSDTVVVERPTEAPLVDPATGELRRRRLLVTAEQGQNSIQPRVALEQEVAGEFAGDVEDYCQFEPEIERLARLRPAEALDLAEALRHAALLALGLASPTAEVEL